MPKKKKPRKDGVPAGRGKREIIIWGDQREEIDYSKLARAMFEAAHEKLKDEKDKAALVS